MNIKKAFKRNVLTLLLVLGSVSLVPSVNLRAEDVEPPTCYPPMTPPKDETATVIKIHNTKGLNLKKVGSKLDISYKSKEKHFQIQVSRKKNSGYKTLVNNYKKKSYTATNKKIRKALNLKRGKSYRLYVRVRSIKYIKVVIPPNSDGTVKEPVVYEMAYGAWTAPKTVKNFRIR